MFSVFSSEISMVVITQQPTSVYIFLGFSILAEQCPRLSRRTTIPWKVVYRIRSTKTQFCFSPTKNLTIPIVKLLRSSTGKCCIFQAALRQLRRQPELDKDIAASASKKISLLYTLYVSLLLSVVTSTAVVQINSLIQFHVLSITKGLLEVRYISTN